MSEPDEAQPDRPPARRHRRASRAATTGHPDAGHWTKDRDRKEPSQEDSEGDGPRRSGVAGRDEDRPESAQDRWWRDQRPPHWG